jgi:hypothetical protein
MDIKRTSDVFPGFAHVYLLGEPGGSKAFRADLSVTLEQAFAATRAEFHPDAAVPAKWMMGGRLPSDVVWTGFAAPVLIGNRVRAVLEASGVRGWTSYPVLLTGKAGDTIPGYHGLAVQGRCGRIDNDRSAKVTKLFPGGAFPVWKGLYFDESSWDGSDVFMPGGQNGWIFVTEKVKAALEQANAKNLSFRSLDQIERSEVEMEQP